MIDAPLSVVTGGFPVCVIGALTSGWGVGSGFVPTLAPGSGPEVVSLLVRGKFRAAVGADNEKE